MNIQITELIRTQSYECLIMFCSGTAFMIICEFGAFLCRRAGLNKWWRMALELFFWLAAAVMVSEFLYYCAFGKISIHCIGAFGAGVLLWKSGFYGTIYPNTQMKNRIKGLRRTHGEEKKKPGV